MAALFYFEWYFLIWKEAFVFWKLFPKIESRSPILQGLVKKLSLRKCYTCSKESLT